MEDIKLTPLLIFIICAAVNDNLNNINFVRLNYKNSIKKQENYNSRLEKVKKNIKSIVTNLFK